MAELKWDAERAAQRVSGVKALAIEMDVKLPGSSKRSDSDIADVTLRGTVQSWAARELAMHSAWGTPGVRSVVDNIAIAY